MEKIIHQKIKQKNGQYKKINRKIKSSKCIKRNNQHMRIKM